MDRSTLNLWVGVFVLAGLAAFLVLAFKVGNLGAVNLSDAYTVTARFDNVGGLKSAAPIRASGVLVGRVQSIRFDVKRYNAVVTMSIDHLYQFPKDTSASILTSGILGEQYIGLDAGGDDQMLKDGGEITLTQSAVVLEKLIGQFLFSKAQDSGGTTPAAKSDATTAGSKAPAAQRQGPVNRAG